MAKQTYLEPAKTIIEAFGGVNAVAGITKRHVSRVYRWQMPKEAGGTDGNIPRSAAVKLLKHARENRVNITAEAFLGVAA